MPLLNFGISFNNVSTYRTAVEHNITHETAICRNPPTHNFTGDRKNLTPPPPSRQTKKLVFRTMQGQAFFSVDTF
jgi:hypothetical protein